MSEREKLIELIDRVLQCLPWGEVSTHTSKDIADHLISNGVTVQKWIPVSERLPQEKGEVCKNVNLLMDDGLVTVGWLNENTGKAYYLDTVCDFITKAPISRCTHWMPLPEPPKECE